MKFLLKDARAKAYAAVNYSMVGAYWLIGKQIVEEMQQSGNRANYGEQVIKNISKALTAEFGKDFSDRSVRQYRQFYQTFPKLPITRVMIAESKSTETVKSDKTRKTVKSNDDSANSVRRIQKARYSIMKGNKPLFWDITNITAAIKSIIKIPVNKSLIWHMRRALVASMAVM